MPIKLSWGYDQDPIQLDVVALRVRNEATNNLKMHSFRSFPNARPDLGVVEFALGILPAWQEELQTRLEHYIREIATNHAVEYAAVAYNSRAPASLERRLLGTICSFYAFSAKNDSQVSNRITTIIHIGDSNVNNF
jgi:hypothetical protein